MQAKLGYALGMTDTISIPGFTVKARLGQGPLAAVYLATQHNARREVALKVFSPVVSSDPGFTARFMHEIGSAAPLAHRSLAPVLEAGRHDGTHYFSMEYLPAGNLRQLIVEGHRDADLAAHVCLSLCAALDAAHGRGLVHRNIKPENILFRADGTPVLVDLGLVRALIGSGSLSAGGMLVEAPSYMSPEQVKGQDLDGRSDLYSLGIVLHEILTGSAPFAAGSSLYAALRQVNDPLPRLPPQHAACQPFLDRLTAKSRSERFATAAEVVDALQEITGHAPRRFVPPPRAPLPASAQVPRMVWPDSPASAPPTGTPPSPAPALETGPVRASARKLAAPLLLGVRGLMASAARPVAPYLARTLPLLPGAAAVASAAVGLTLIVGSVSHLSSPRVDKGAEVTAPAPAPQVRTPSASAAHATHRALT